MVGAGAGSLCVASPVPTAVEESLSFVDFVSVFCSSHGCSLIWILY